MYAEGAWADSNPGDTCDAYVKLFADGTQIYGRSFTECGFSPIFPELPDHHSFEHHYMFALADGKESVFLMSEIFDDMALDDVLDHVAQTTIQVQTRYIRVKIKLVFDWWLHVYTSPGMAEPNAKSPEEIICFRCPFQAVEKRNWDYSRGPRHANGSLGADILLPSIELSDRYYDPLHANPRQLSLVCMCILEVLNEMNHPILACISEYLTSKCNYSHQSGFNPKNTKMFLSNRMWHHIVYVLHQELEKLPLNDFRSYFAQFCEDVEAVYEAVTAVHCTLYQSDLSEPPTHLEGCETTIQRFLYTYHAPLWPAVHHCFDHMLEDFMELWPIAPYHILNESNEAFHKRLRIWAELVFVRDSVRRAGNLPPCTDAIMKNALLYYLLKEILSFNT